MSLFRKSLIGAIVIALLITTTSYAYVDNSITLTAHESNITHSVDLRMYAIGGEWPAYGNAHLVNYAKGGGANMEFVNQMKELGFNMESFRVAGVSSTGFKWKESLGYYPERSEMNLGYNSTNPVRPVMGPLELAKFVRAFNPKGGDLTYTINLIRESPEDTADLAEFYYGDGKKNYNGGINWAQKRIVGGVKEPVHIAAWELGNEFDASGFSHMFINYKLYVQKCKEAIAAIRSVKLDAPIALCNSMMAGYDAEWGMAMYSELGNEAEYVQKHGYITMDSAYKRDKEFKDIADFLDEKFGKGTKGILVTETNSQGKLSLQEGSDVTEQGWGGCMYFGGARANADMLTRWLRIPNVIQTNLFMADSGTSYSTFYIDNDGKYKLNPAAMNVTLFQKYGIGDVIKSDITGFEIGYQSKVSGAVIKDKDDFVNVILINNTNDTDFFVNFDFEKDYRAVEKSFIQANEKGPWAANYIGINEVKRYTEQIESTDVVRGYTVPKATIMAIKLKEAK